jgi:group I intron endonuclease
MNKIVGIYKITNPKGAVYIGESKDIYKRWKTYKRLYCEDQPKLYNSFVKYGVENHTFEIIKECKAEEIPYYERHYQEYYNVLDRELGLNLKYRSTNEKKELPSEETRKKMSDIRLEKFKNGEIKSWNKGRTGVYSEDKIKEMTRNLHTKEVRKKIADKKRGVKHSEDHKSKIKKSCKGINSKKVINTETGETYNGLTEMCEILNISYNTMKPKLNGARKNNTPFRYI